MGPVEILKQPRLMIGQRAALCKLKVDPLLKTTSTQLIEYRKFELVASWSFYSYILVSLVWEGTL